VQIQELSKATDSPRVARSFIRCYSAPAVYFAQFTAIHAFLPCFFFRLGTDNKARASTIKTLICILLFPPPFSSFVFSEERLSLNRRVEDLLGTDHRVIDWTPRFLVYLSPSRPLTLLSQAFRFSAVSPKGIVILQFPGDSGRLGGVSFLIVFWSVFFDFRSFTHGVSLPLNLTGFFFRSYWKRLFCAVHVRLPFAF